MIDCSTRSRVRMTRVEMERSSIRTRHRCGYTLFEIVLSLMAMGIMAAMAVPSGARWLDGVRVREAASQVNWALEEAKSLSVSTGNTQEVVFCVAQGRIHIPGRIDPKRRKAPHTLELERTLLIANARFGQAEQPVFIVRDRGRTITEGVIIIQGSHTWIRIDVTTSGITIGVVQEGIASGT